MIISESQITSVGDLQDALADAPRHAKVFLLAKDNPITEVRAVALWTPKELALRGLETDEACIVLSLTSEDARPNSREAQ